jgi:hypothetical protein
VSVYVFTGPTISAAEASDELEAVYLPPAAEGDVYRVTLQRPQAIGIIDGYFQSIPAVRHKEILWAMNRGVHVFGSASMGALRAAELAAFGMEGVGIIFKLYRDGVLEDDDEVAIAHGPAEVEFLAASEAMVNIRKTLQKAELLGVVSTELRVALEKIGKELFYPDRNYPLLLRYASECGLPETQLARLRQWLPENRVNQKRQDAVAMLRLMHRRLTKGLTPKKVSYCFAHTAMWESTWRQCGELRFDSNAQARAVASESLLDELRLEGDHYRQHTLMTLERFFAIREAERLGMSVSPECRRKTEIAFCRERDLAGVAEVEDWMRGNDLSHNDFDALLMDEARVRWVHQLAQFISVSRLPEQLRLSGDYPRLRARAMAKGRLLESIGLKNPCLENADLTKDQLLHWYFEGVLGRPTPDDPNRYAHGLGYASSDAFRRALIKEYLYRRMERQKKATEQTT